MARPALTSDIDSLERNTQHSHLTMRGTKSPHHVRMAQPLHLTMEGTLSSHHVEMAKPLHLTLTCQNGLAFTSDLHSLEWPSTHI